MVAMMQGMTKDNLKFYLGDLLQEKYLDAMWDRWENLTKLITDILEQEKGLAASEKTLQVVRKEDWNEETIQKFENGRNFYLFRSNQEAVRAPQAE